MLSRQQYTAAALTLGPALLALELQLLLLLLTMRLSYTRRASSDAPTASSQGLCLWQPAGRQATLSFTQDRYR
jgi:hypothetical protein